MKVVEVYAHCEEAAHDNASEDYTCLSKVEAIQRTVDKRKGLEKGIVDAVNESGVEIGEQDGGILEHDFERFNKGIKRYSTSCEATTIDLALRADVWVLVELAETHRTAKEDIAG